MRTNAGGVVNYSEDTGSRLSRNAWKYLPDHMASYTGRMPEYSLWQKLTVPLPWLQNIEAGPTPNTGLSSCLFRVSVWSNLFSNLSCFLV